MIKNKRGDEEATAIPWGLLLGILLVLAGGFFLGKWTISRAEASEKFGESTLCSLSIAGSILSSEEMRAKCPIREFTVSKSALLEKTGQKTGASKYIKDFSTSNAKVNELFARLLFECSRNGGGPNSKAFSRQWHTGISGTQTVCLECATVSFDNDAKLPFTGLREYLEENEFSDSKKKYSDYLTKDESHKSDWINFGIDNELSPGKQAAQLATDKMYAVFFMGIKQSTSAALAKFKLISREDTYYVYAAPSEKYNEICQRKVN